MIIEIQCTMNGCACVIPKPSPHPQSVETLSSTKLVPRARKPGDRLQVLSGVVSQFHLVIDHVVPKAEEITSDATYVVQVNSVAEKMECVQTVVDT